MPNFNDPNISEECLRCRERVIAKSKENTFDIDCTGIFPADYKLQQQVSRPLTEGERKAANSLLDPVGWAKEVLDWEPRVSKEGIPYQETMLRCDAKRKVSRIGRRCVVGDTPVLMGNGLWKNIKDIETGEYVASRDEQGKIVEKKVLSFFDNGEQDIYEVVLTNGSKIRCTSNHPLLAVTDSTDDKTTEEWLSIDDGITISTKVAVASCLDSGRGKYGLESYSCELSEVLSLSKIGTERTYDIEVSDTHNFIANNIVTHNSGKTDSLCVHILHNATTKTRHDILVVCPQKSHAQVIYDRLIELIDDSRDLKASLKRAVKTPYAEIEFHNSSIIKLFTSGSKSGSEGQSIRGQSCDALYLDEADYLESGDFNALSALLYTNPEVTLWSSSTPKGTREKFYDQCHDSRFREFHYPSSVLPFWNDQMDKDARLDCGTEAGYAHEILAEFGEEVEGVYQNQYVDRSLISYKYEDQKREDGWIYCMGVDWNDTKIGTQIVIVGFNPASNKYRIVATHCVDKVGWTQLAAIDKIKEVNEYWRCDHIYCDAGFGQVQVELLQQFGERRLSEVGATHPDAMLRYVKGISAGGILETKNIRTGITENKPAKPYMIENSVRYFEHDIMEMSKHDEELEAEVLGYVVERRTQAGAPVYAQGNKRVGDHVLDAMVLSLLAFTMEFTEFGQILTRSCVSFGGSFGERKASRGAPMPGTVELVIEGTYKRREEKNKRDASKPQDRFDVGQDNILSRGTPGIIQSYNSITGSNKSVRTGIKRLKQTRPTRSNI